jgi:GT2 family glycosyltransferase
MRIGIGITANDRPQMLEECLQSIYKHTDMANVTIDVADDTIDKKVVAFKKNECLRALQGCDYVFLLDDDVKVIKEGWVDVFILFSKNVGVEHLLFLNKSHQLKKTLQSGYIVGGCSAVEYYQDCGGVFMFMTKKAIEKVGAFNEKFTPYGFEHCEYSIRILGERNNYPMLKGTDEYVFAHDYSTYGHKSSITDAEKQLHVKNNWNKFFKEPIKQTYIHL